MICPCCTVVEVSSEHDVCELCGYSIAANVATEAGAAPPPESPTGAAAHRTRVKVAAKGSAGNGTAIAITVCDAKGRRVKQGGDRVVVGVTGANRSRPPVTDVGNGTYTATYTPTAAGTDLLAITLNGVPVKGSPFKTVVSPGPADPSRTSATVPEGAAGRITAVVITARDANGNALVGGGERVAVTVAGANEGAEVIITDNGDHTYTANYVPNRTGTDEITVLINDLEIAGSPFESDVHAGPANAKKTEVVVPERGTPGQGITVSVRARDAFGNRVRTGGDRVSVDVTGANTARPTVTDVGNGTYTSTYTPTAVGVDRIVVKLGRTAVGGSPFDTVISAGTADASQTTATLPVGTAGQVSEIVMRARDAHGNALESGGDRVKVSVRGANRVTPDVVDGGDGTYRASYTPTVAGTDQISITVNGAAINGSPFAGEVEPGPLVPEWTTIRVPEAAAAGEPCTLVVETRDGYRNPVREGGEQVVVEVDGVNAGSPVEVEDMGDGTYACTYTPAHVGEDTFRVLVHDAAPVEPAAPLTIAPARAVPAETVAKVPDGVAGKPTRIEVTPRDRFGNAAPAGDHILDGMVVGANDGADLRSERRDDGTWILTYVPTSAGTDYLTVEFDGVAIGDSPIASTVAPGSTDAEQTVAMLPSVCRAGARTNVFITAHDAFGNRRTEGGDTVVVSLVDLNEHDDVGITDNGDGTYLVQFTPTATGDGEILVTINGEQLGESPFDYHVAAGVVDPLQSVASGADAGVVGEPLDITIQARDRFGNNVPEGRHDVEVIVTGANDGVPVSVVDHEDGRYTASYRPVRPGTDRLAVTIDGTHIGGEPLRPVIGVGGASVHSTAEIPSGRAGRVSTITITARDASGNETRTGGDRVQLSVSVANSAQPEVIDHGDGTYTASYTPTSTGTDYITITINGSPLVGCPFQSRIAAGATDASQTVANVPPTARAGQPSTITLTMRDVHGNEVTHGGQLVRIAVAGANDGRSLQVTDNQDGTFVATYTPTTAGRDEIEITVGGKRVGGGTFTSIVKPGPPSLRQTTASFPPGTVGNLTTIVVTLRDTYKNQVAGHKTLRLALEGANAGTPLQVTDNRDGTYTATYVPTIAGTDSVRIYVDEEEIGDSPVSAAVSAGRAASDRTAALVPDGRAGEPTTITVTARDAYGNPLTDRQGVEVMIKGANLGSSVAIFDQEGGTFTATYTPQRAGIDQIVINLNGELIRGGPFTSTVEPGWVSPTHCSATVPAGAVGTPSSMTILARDALDNDLTVGGAAVDVQVMGANVGTPVHVTDRGNGTYVAVYTPMRAGTDDIAVTVNGVAIGGSPFQSRIVAGRIEQTATVRRTVEAPGPGGIAVVRRSLQPTMVCPRCSAAEISPDTHQCELCGLMLLNALVPRRGAITEPEPEPEPEREVDVKTRIANELAGEFQLESILGQTERGITYLARSRSDGRQGVLKVLLRSVLTDDEQDVFVQTIERLVQLRHPQVVPVLRWGISDVCLWYLSEFIPGRSFSDVMRDDSPMPLSTCVNWIEQIAGGLDHMHRRGVVHGNLTPSNIVVDAQGWVHLTDVALFARRTPDEASSPEYLAPEQFDPEPVGPGADQFALSLLTYECLTGVQPFRTDDPEELRERHHEPVIPVHERRPEIPASVSEAIARALDPMPAARFPRITDYVEGLGMAAAPVPVAIQEPRASHAERARVFVPIGPPRPFPWVGIAAGAASILALAATISIVSRVESPGRALVGGVRPTGVAPADSSTPPAQAPPDTALPVVPSPVSDTAAPPLTNPDQVPVTAPSAGPVVTVSEPSPEPTTVAVDSTETSPAPRGTAAPVETAPAGRDTVAREPAVPERPVSRFGLFSVSSEPAARLFIDERPMGVTPGVNLPLDPGKHLVRIVLFGYREFETEIEIAAGQRLVLPKVTLRPR